jgi:hypothetical protein
MHDEVAQPAVADLKAENERLRDEINAARAEQRLTDELRKVGARSPSLLFASVKGDLQFAEDGSPLNTAALVERLRRDFPEQFGADRPQPIDAAAGHGRQGIISRESLAAMKPDEIAKLNWDDVRAALSAGQR